MAMNSIWWEIARAPDEAIDEFVDDLQLNVRVIPFVSAPGTDDEDGSFTRGELKRYLKEFARQIAHETLSEVKV
jgi:hypothetical protein